MWDSLRMMIHTVDAFGRQRWSTCLVAGAAVREAGVR